MNLLFALVLLFAIYFFFLAVAVWILLPTWAVNYIGIDLIDWVKAKASGDEGALIGRKLRERIGLALWNLSRRLVALEERGVQAHISYVVQTIAPNNARSHIVECGVAKGIEDIARYMLSSGTTTIIIDLSVRVEARVTSEDSVKAVRQASLALTELRLVQLANIPFKEASNIVLLVKGWIC